MLEHIFRNINDIRIFDVMTDFVSSDCAMDIYENTDLYEKLRQERENVGTHL